MTIYAFEEAVETDEGYEDDSMKYWLSWAYNYADKLDPMAMFKGRKIK